MNKYGYIKVASALPSVRVADCEYNAERTVEMMRRAAERGVRVVVFPELGLTAASCGDLLRQPMLLAAAEQALERVAKASGELGIAAIVGLPIAVGERIFNCAAVVADGQVAGVVPKQHIPNFGEWQQGRWFASGAGFEQCALANYAGQKVQFGHPSMTLFNQNLLVIYLETARNKTDPTDCSTPGFPVFRYLPEFA